MPIDADVIAAWETTVDGLWGRVLSEEDMAKADKIVAEAAEGDPLQGLDAKSKVRLLIVRARARLLKPSYSKEAENDLSKALKLRSTNTLAWVAMSECLWKRDAIKEARDALVTALTHDPKCIPALCQQSRILRVYAGKEASSNEERLQLMEESVAKAKEAIALDMNDGEAWAALGMALIQLTVSSAMDLTLMRKANQALVQAVRRRDFDPDILYNRGVVRRCLGDFSGASEDFQAAYRLDPAGLQVADRDRIAVTARLESFSSVIKFVTGEGGTSNKAREFRKQMAKLPVMVDGGAELLPITKLVSRVGGPKTVHTALRVLQLVSPNTEQPLCYVAADREGNFVSLLVYRVAAAAIQPNCTAYISFPSSSVTEHTHTFLPLPKADKEGNIIDATEKLTLHLASVVTDPTGLSINGRPIEQHHIKVPSLATRQFA